MSARPVFTGDTGGTLSARTSITISRQASWQPGDVVTVWAMLRSGTVVPTLPGFTQIGRQVNLTSSRTHQLVAFWRRDDGTGSSWTMSWDGSSITCDWGGRAWRGCPPTGSPIDGYASAASATTVGAIPYAPATLTGTGTVLWLVASYQTSYPDQPAQWFYGANNGDGYVRAFEYPFGVRGLTPSPAPNSQASDAWTSMTFALRDGARSDPAYDIPFGLDGINSPNNGGWPGGYDDAVELGVNHLRIDFGPGDTQLERDTEFADAAANGLRVLPVISQYQRLSTIDKAAFATYVGAFVARYGPGGTFWAGRSDGELAPEWIELFNEPYGWWFYGTVEPADYADVYIQSVVAGRAANPACKYLIACTDRYNASGWQPWVAPMFTAQPTLGNYIDGVTLHEYGFSPLNLAYWGNYQQWPQIESIMTDLAARGVNVKAWITEFGFTTCTNAASPDYGVGEALQASQILRALHLFHGRWSDLVGGTFLYRYRDGPADSREDRWGIVNYDGTRKPAFDALRSALPLYVSGLPVAIRSPFGARLFAMLEPWQTDDLARYCDAIGAMFDPVYQLVSDQGFDGDTDYVPGYGVLFDIDACPASCLPYLGQFVGVSIPAGADEATARALVRAESGLSRGTLASIQSAVERSISASWAPNTHYLAGTLVAHDPGTGAVFYTVDADFTSDPAFSTANLTPTNPKLWYRLFERQRQDATTDAYALTIYVRPEHLTPTNDTTAILAAVNANKPAGIVLYLVVTDSPRWLDATLTWATASGTMTWAGVSAGSV